MTEKLQGSTYTCYNGKYEVVLNTYQTELLSRLLSGDIHSKKLTELRSNARRYGNLERSLELSTVNEVYKHEVKYGERKNTS